MQDSDVSWCCTWINHRVRWLKGSSSLCRVTFPGLMLPSGQMRSLESPQMMKNEVFSVFRVYIESTMLICSVCSGMTTTSTFLLCKLIHWPVSCDYKTFLRWSSVPLLLQPILSWVILHFKQTLWRCELMKCLIPVCRSRWMEAVGQVWNCSCCT